VLGADNTDLEPKPSICLPIIISSITSTSSTSTSGSSAWFTDSSTSSSPGLYPAFRRAQRSFRSSELYGRIALSSALPSLYSLPPFSSMICWMWRGIRHRNPTDPGLNSFLSVLFLSASNSCFGHSNSVSRSLFERCSTLHPPSIELYRVQIQRISGS